MDNLYNIQYTVFINYYSYKDLVEKKFYMSIKKGIFNPYFYDNVINKAEILKSETSQYVKSFKRLWLSSYYNVSFEAGFLC